MKSLGVVVSEGAPMRRRLLAVVVVSIVAAFGFVGGNVGRASSAPRPPRRVDAPASVPDGFQARSSRNAAVGKHLTALPTWTGSFVSGGVAYPYTMVGTDPAAGSARTTVPVQILPLRLSFDDGGVTLDGTDTLHDVVHSPVFKKASYRSGHSQYGDAMQRASFWDSVQSKSPGYHVQLQEPKILPTLSLEVPAGSGFGFHTSNGPAGLVTTSYLFSLAPQLSNYYDPASLLIIVVKDVEGDGFLGFHFAFTPPGKTVPLTLIFTGYFTPNVVVSPNIADAYVLTHEVAEWINDPYVNNAVPPWRDPASGVCFNNLLEVGDPVEFLPTPSFEVRTNGTTYHVTDVAGVSWFAHDVPSRELGGAYSYNGNLTSFSELC